nr:HNH endonuclease signature motif containing protein [Geodermatophilus normandii]
MPWSPNAIGRTPGWPALVRAAELSQAPERDCLRSMASWLRGHCRLSAAEASRLVRNGRALEHLPALGEAHDAGLVSAEQVALAARAVPPERLTAAAAQGVDLTVIDAVFTQVAVEQSHADLAQVVQRDLDDLDPDGSEPDPTEQRSLTLAKHADGSLSIRGELDAVGGERLQAALEAHVQADRPAGDERTRAQRLGDALVQLCDNTLASGNLPVLRGHKPQVAVVVELADLADPATGPGAGQMGFGAVISAARTRWLACDGAVSRVVFGPDGVPLDLGCDHRLAGRHIRRATELRDGGCVFTGCTAPTHWCDVHRLVHWIDGGETSLENSALLCERHHTKVHHGFRIERQPDGTWRTWRPDGSQITVPAALSPAARPRPGRGLRARRRLPAPEWGCCGGWRGRSRPAPAAGRRRGRG